MGDFVAKGLVLLIGLWLIVGGGSCVVMAGFNLFGLIGLGMGLLGGWIIWVVFRPRPENEPEVKDKE
jgi:hypothetical protein